MCRALLSDAAGTVLAPPDLGFRSKLRLRRKRTAQFAVVAVEIVTGAERSRFRQSLGDTQQQFASRTGLSVTSVARYETNSRPSSKVLARFASIAREANFPAFVEIFEHKIAPDQELDLQNFSAVKQLLDRLVKRLHPRQLVSARLALACLLTLSHRGRVVFFPGRQLRNPQETAINTKRPGLCKIRAPAVIPEARGSRLDERTDKKW